jgi:hypothetical protein
MPVTYPIETRNSPFGIQNISFGIYSTTGKVSNTRDETKKYDNPFQRISLMTFFPSLLGPQLLSATGSLTSTPWFNMVSLNMEN